MAIRPITGSGSRRRAAASPASAPPPAWPSGRKASAALGRRLERQRAGADLARAGHHLHREPACDSRGDGWQDAFGLRRDRLLLAVKQPQCRHTLGQSGGIAVEPERRRDGRDPDLVEAQRPFHRVAVERGDKVLLADDEARLRATQKLVAGEGHEVRTVGDRLTHGRLVAQAQAREIGERAGAQIVDERQTMRAGKGREITRLDARREALDAIIGSMDLEDEAGIRPDRGLVVLEVGAVGGADLRQQRAGAGHDVRHAKGAADLDQLAARDDRPPPQAQRVEDEQDGRGIVVDHGRVLGPGQLAQEAAKVIVALAAPAGREVELERQGAAHGLDRGLDRRFGEQRPAEIGVQHGAGEVEHRAGRGSGGGRQRRRRSNRQPGRVRRRGTLAHFLACPVQRLADGGAGLGVAELRQRPLGDARAQDLIDRRQLAQARQLPSRDVRHLNSQEETGCSFPAGNRPGSAADQGPGSPRRRRRARNPDSWSGRAPSRSDGSCRRSRP